MKFTPEVVAALAVLRANAENDFERHRINVLERDLTAPPQVEIIDDTHQRFNGVVYQKNKSKHYSKFQSIYRDVWTYYKGEIPEGDYDIHHVDNNPANNSIDNLKLLTKSEHIKLHKTNPPIKKVCPICGITFIAPSNNPEKICCSRSCSYKLVSLSRQKPHDERVCPICGEKFIVPHTNHSQIYCSQNCYAESKKVPEVKRTCPVCGNDFIISHKKQIYCSKKCSSKINAKKRYENSCA